jgi:electron transfer flavoprotein beta subunit
VNVVVCVKQVPGPDAPARLDAGTHRPAREGEVVLDDADSYSVEVALRLVEEAGGGEVALVSMVPDGAVTGVRTALAMGADRAVVVSDPALAGSDGLGTAKVLAAVVRRSLPDLVLAATESTDGYTGTVPVQLAALLGWPAVSFAKAVALAGDRLRVQRQTDDGSLEVECPLPAVVTVTAGVVEVRYPSFKGIMSARTKPVEQLDLAALGLSPEEVGETGARQQVLSVRAGEARAAGEVVVDDGVAHEQIVAALRTWKIL